MKQLALYFLSFAIIIWLLSMLVLPKTTELLLTASPAYHTIIQ